VTADGSGAPPAGWYPDPSDPRVTRWWDGVAWTPPATAATGPDDWARRFVESPSAGSIGRAVVVLASVGAGIAAVVAVTSVVRERPASGLALLLVPGIPTLAAGQLWAIAVLRARNPTRARGWRSRRRRSRLTGYRHRTRFLFGDLDARIVAGLVTGFVVGWLLAMTSFFFLTDGGPDGSRPGCPYALTSHGSITCVSQETYERAGAAEQRLASGVFLSFFCLHIGVAAGGLRRVAARS
jgi:hypothetical protein